MKIFNRAFLNFFVVNIIVVTSLHAVFILLFNGEGNDFPLGQLLAMSLISLPIIFCQYPLLALKRNWYYKTLIFYLSMNIFLFVAGIFFGLSEMDRNFSGAIEDGLKAIILGQIASILFLPAIVIINWAIIKNLEAKSV